MQKMVLQFLNARSLLLFAATAIAPITKIIGSEQSKILDLMLIVSNLIESFWLYLSFAV